jgi:glyoxylase-like metal-dependent hydrolase (beta-lactamase superfamily II)
MVGSMAQETHHVAPQVGTVNCEIEFLAVGEGAKAGDAIIVRYGEPNAYNLILIDGGTSDTGEKIVAHLKAEFGEHVSLAHVLLTHSDADHASGLRTVLKEIPVKNVWLHLPWLLSKEAIHLFRINALSWAANYAKASGLPLQQFSFVQIPHHGSRRNVGPAVLNAILGPIQPEGAASRFAAFVSVPTEDDTHPRKIVLNAFMRRGGRVIATQGSNKVHRGGFPMRDGYNSVTPLAFSTKVEAYDWRQRI